MANVYIVKSGQLVDFSGWEWLNLKAFSDYDKAVEYHNQVAKQINPDDYGINEDVDIECLTLEVE
jgi:hypothetical protein